MEKKYTPEQYAKNRMILNAFRELVAKNKASKHPIPTTPPPPEMVAIAKRTPNAHIESLGNLHFIVIEDYE